MICVCLRNIVKRRNEMNWEIKLPNKITKFEKEVKKYEEKEVALGKILFYGASDFTRWSEKYGNRPMEEEIRMKDGTLAVVNHGLGGSTSEELLYYYSRMVRAWKPRALVFKSFGNNYAYNYTLDETMFLQSRIFEYARQDMPGIKIYICDAHPVLKHQGDKEWFKHLEEYNKCIKDYCALHDDCTFVCQSQHPLFYENASDVGDYSKIRTDIFLEDLQHYNQTGYNLYKQFFCEVLDDIL